MTHSGLQFGGRPMKFGRQEQAGTFPSTLQCEWGPQGDGIQGFCCSTAVSVYSI